MKPIALLTLALALSPVLALQAQNDQPAQAVVVQATRSPAPLPYGVEDILKLSKAKVSEEVVVSYIQNSGTIYNLKAQDIVYLRDEGVSDHIVSVMLGQSKYVAANPPAYAPPQPVQPMAPAQDYVQPAPVYTQPASSVYVI